MSPKGRGNKKTPARVMELLQDEVKRTSQAATAKATGLTLQTVQRYIKGIGEPTTATLKKLADYFKTSAAYLRGEPWATREGGVRTDVAVSPESQPEYENTFDRAFGVTTDGKIRDLLFRSVAYPIYTKTEEGNQDLRESYIVQGETLIKQIQELLPELTNDWKRWNSVFKERLADIQGIVKKLKAFDKRIRQITQNQQGQ